jgi:hypothetical protein
MRSSSEPIVRYPPLKAMPERSWLDAPTDTSTDEAAPTMRSLSRCMFMRSMPRPENAVSSVLEDDADSSDQSAMRPMFPAPGGPFRAKRQCGRLISPPQENRR